MQQVGPHFDGEWDGFPFIVPNDIAGAIGFGEVFGSGSGNIGSLVGIDPLPLQELAASFGLFASHVVQVPLEKGGGRGR